MIFVIRSVGIPMYILLGMSMSAFAYVRFWLELPYNVGSMLIVLGKA